jgi:serine/threonine protein phosphatase 1
MMLSVCEGREDLSIDWLLFGGDATLASYDAAAPAAIARDYPKHLDFIRNSVLFFETPRHFFVHGSYQADLPLEEQPREDLLWSSLKRGVPGPHVSGKKAVVGHTAQKDGEVLDLGHLVCIDTYCYGDGWLTALEVETERLWQADKAGRLRPGERKV